MQISSKSLRGFSSSVAFIKKNDQSYWNRSEFWSIGEIKLCDWQWKHFAWRVLVETMTVLNTMLTRNSMKSMSISQPWKQKNSLGVIWFLFLVSQIILAQPVALQSRTPGAGRRWKNSCFTWYPLGELWKVNIKLLYTLQTFHVCDLHDLCWE